jgi:hypothetical protein
MAARKFLGKDLRYRNRVWLYEKYIQEQMSAYEIARLIGAKHNTIGEWLDRFGIHRRSVDEAYRTNRSHSKRIGQRNAHWRGGEYRNTDGRVYVFQPTHPHAWTTGYVARSRLIIEKTLGRYLGPDEFVHHINGKEDDDHLENLRVLSPAEHGRLHAIARRDKQESCQIPTPKNIA